MNTKSKIQHYINLAWSYTVEQETHEGKRYFIVRVNELPGVCTDGETIQEAMELIKEPLESAIKLYLENGEEVPVPLDVNEFKGKILYRTDPKRHYRIARRAKMNHKSISKTIDDIIDNGLKNIP